MARKRALRQEPLRFCDINVPYAPAWQPLAGNRKFRDALERAEERIAADVDAGTCTPLPDCILRFLQVPRVQAVVVGQDPYSQAGLATGFALEVGNLRTWMALAERYSENADGSVNEAAAVRSLVRLFYMTATDWSTKHAHRPSYKEAARAADAGDFYLLAPEELFDYWQQVGILPLNTSLSTRVDEPHTHRKAWTTVRRLIVKHITETWPHATWFLWGSAAVERFAYRLPGGTACYKAGHPNLQGTAETDPLFFFRASGIPDTWEWLKWTGPGQRPKNSMPASDVRQNS
ncbi:hypothetical protein [Pyxidicoccus trucidator]|uniref:hypothetical protein n=1 Tax=Pyxidicoccus trucidator TaxID=2709662 RepID=UPI0013D969DC|nr:hypothetical protein [Pyxidicoccus trucidator]